MRVAICSLRFSPGHLSHIVAYAKLFREVSSEIILWLHQDYSKLFSNNQFSVSWYPMEYPENVETLFFLYNASTKNHLVAREYKFNGTKIIYVYHEPWAGFSEYLKEGFKQTLKASIAHHFSTKTLKLADLVIVPSNYALRLYKRTDMRYNENVVSIPLLLDDELDKEIDPKKKVHFSYIGHAVKGHAFYQYISIIKKLSKLDKNFKFQIATRTNIGSLLSSDSVLKKLVSQGRLVVKHGRPLTNAEINEAYETSLCVWNIYRRSTQSGVLPKAFMFGTPVIASNIGSFPEYVKSGENGFLVNEKVDAENIAEKLEYIDANIEHMALNCRNTFLQTFFWKRWVNDFALIISSFV